MAAAPAASPDFRSRQQYLDAAPAGIDAPYAWTLPGGRGQGVKVVDCEWGWQVAHEDLQANSLGIVAGTIHSSTNHGTAVWGEIGGDVNTLGIVGISPDAQLGASSFVNRPTAATIDSATNALSAGDIILLDPGPSAWRRRLGLGFNTDFLVKKSLIQHSRADLPPYYANAGSWARSARCRGAPDDGVQAGRLKSASGSRKRSRTFSSIREMLLSQPL